MTSISIKHTIDETRKQLNAFQRKQIPFATRLTLNALARTSKLDVDKQILRKIDRPRSYTKRMMRVQSANKTTLTARVKVKDTATVTKRGQRGPDQVLGHLFKGGTRQSKGMEVLLRRRGLLRPDRYVVPGEGAPLDKHGNVEAGLIIKLLSFFQAFNESGFRANADAKGRAKIGRSFARKRKVKDAEFFIVSDRGKSKSKLHPGIWARFKFAKGVAVKPILMFVRTPFYRRPVINLEKTANKVIERDISNEFNVAIRRALATAR